MITRRSHPWPLTNGLPLSAGETSSHASGQLGGKLGVLLLNLELGTCSLGIGQGIDNLSWCSSELSSTLKVLQGVNDLSLLQKELSHGGNSNIALGIN